MLTPGTHPQNRYEILKRIGSGDMSVVYETQCHTLNHLVTIKVLKEGFAFDENFVGKFGMEAQSMARLFRPDIVNVCDVVDEDVYHHIVMELIEGTILKNYMEDKGYLENKEAIGIVLQVGQGIAAAYEQYIIHRDIKPQNMVISRDGKMEVTDFGIARIVSSQTMNATVVGSARYTSPEQVRGGHYDERSDVYSSDITMYKVVAGRVSSERGDTVAVALAHLEKPVTPPGQCASDMPRVPEQIILKRIRKRPDRRYSCVASVIEDLRTALMDPDVDIYARRDGEEDELGKTRPITREELNSIQEGKKTHPEETPEEPEEEQTGYPDRKRSRDQHKKDERVHTRKKDDGDDVSIQSERVITASGIVTAIIVVAVILFAFSQLTGLFRQSSSKPTTETVTMTTGGSTAVVDISTKDQVNMPSVLGLPQDMAREGPKGNSLVMEVTGSECSNNYAKGQIMGQDILTGAVARKWSTVGVTVGRGSNKVGLNTMDLTQITGEDARLLLEQKGLTIKVKEENSDTVIKGNVIRLGPQVVKVGEGVSLYVGKGSQNMEGRVPNLQGQTSTSADALLAGAGLLTGNIITEVSNTVEEGLIISQLEPPGTILLPGTVANYVVSGKPAQTQASDERYCTGSTDEACSLSNYTGSTSQTSSACVLVYLNQTNDEDASVYITLMNPRLVVGAQTVPMVLLRIKRAYGVDSGMVEVVNADNSTITKSYPVVFFPVG